MADEITRDRRARLEDQMVLQKRIADLETENRHVRRQADADAARAAALEEALRRSYQMTLSRRTRED